MNKLPTFCSLNTCVPVILNWVNCSSLNAPWVFNTPVYFAHSPLIPDFPLSPSSPIELLPSLQDPTLTPSTLMKFFQIFPVRSVRSISVSPSTLCFCYSTKFSCMLQLVVSSCFLTVRACKSRYISDSSSSPMAIGHTHI